MWLAGPYLLFFEAPKSQWLPSYFIIHAPTSGGAKGGMWRRRDGNERVVALLVASGDPHQETIGYSVEVTAPAACIYHATQDRKSVV